MTTPASPRWCPRWSTVQDVTAPIVTDQNNRPRTTEENL